MTSPANAEPLRVLIVGAGACGMSAAYAFSQSPPGKFDVKVYERSSNAGGMATSAPISKEKYGAEYINDGVQGASPVFHNTYALFEKLGFSSSEVGMQVSFGRDPETEFWSNVFPSQVIDKFKDDIKKFGKVLKIIKTLESIFAMISVSAMLRMFRFSKEFGEVIVFPLVALFFGTGNQTPFISSAILERVFMDPNMRLFEYSPDTFLASIPEMRAFPRLSLLYSTWAEHVQSAAKATSPVKVVTDKEVLRVERSKGKKGRGGVKVWSRKTRGTDNGQQVVEPSEEEEMEVFDELILCTDADAALNILGKDAGWLERKVLGNVKYLWDVTVTHSDLAYMEKYYQVQYSSNLNSKSTPSDPEQAEEQKKKFEFAEKNFEPLYFIRSYPSDKKKVEMSFDLTVYQPQFDGVPERGPHVEEQQKKQKKAPSTSSSSAQENGETPASGTSPTQEFSDGLQDQSGAASSTRHSDRGDQDSRIPLEQHVFQTIFLDNSPGSKELWSKEDIDSDKIIMEKWWKQQSHRWQHYAGTVPWMGLINGKNHTHFAGAWTILNMHEIAVVSGFGAAYRLGAAYPFKEDEECKRLFGLCLAANHMARMRKEDRKGFFM